MKPRPALVILVLWTAAVLWLIYLADAGNARWFFSCVGETPGADKLGHFILYGGISFFANLVGQGRKMVVAGRPVLKWTLILMALATLEEFSQLFFRWRSFELWDLAAGAVGIWWFGTLADRVLRRQAARPKSAPDQTNL